MTAAGSKVVQITSFSPQNRAREHVYKQEKKNTYFEVTLSPWRTTAHTQPSAKKTGHLCKKNHRHHQNDRSVLKNGPIHPIFFSKPSQRACLSILIIKHLL
jgi:hypothetical protein